MSYLSKAGHRFKLDLKKVPKGYLGRFEKMQKQAQPPFLRSTVPIDLSKDNQIPEDPKKLKYLVGDRVVIVKGPKRGNICKVTRHVQGGGYMLDENGPLKTVVVPKLFWAENQTTHVVTYPTAVTEDIIRLVADIEDAETKKVKPVAVDNLIFRGVYYDEDYKKAMPYRRVYNDPELVIPWPRPEAKEDGPQCTEVEDVKERTFFVESAVRSPIPEEALNSIRNRYSKHTRRKITEKDVRRLTPPEMPVPEASRVLIEDSRARAATATKVNITDEMKAFIGAKVREHQKLLDAKRAELLKQ